VEKGSVQGAAWGKEQETGRIIERVIAGKSSVTGGMKSITWRKGGEKQDKERNQLPLEEGVGSNSKGRNCSKEFRCGGNVVI